MSTSGTVRPSAPPSRAGDRSPGEGSKIAKPEDFHGNRDSLSKWLTQVGRWLHFNNISQDRTLVATSYLKERAEDWIQPLVEKYLDQGSDESGIFADYARFKREIRRVFAPTNQDAMAERALIDITQTRSVSDYAALFKKYADRTEWDDDALMAMFKRGLKDSVKDELMRYGGISSGLGDLIRIAIELDDKIYFRLVEKRGTKPKYERTGFAYGGRQQGDRHQPVRDPMELDAVQVKRTFKGKKPVSGGKETRKCYACGKAGHITRDCRSKNKVERRQFDMVDKYYPPEEREEEDSEL